MLAVVILAWNCDGSILYVLATSKNLNAGGVMLSPYLVQPFLKQ
jgi:hypothetical protein